MTSDELKKKIAEIIDNAFENRCRKTNCHNCDLYPDEMCQPNMYADALIAAGIRFGENLTATFDHMTLEREHELERRLAEAERRAEVFERALDMACELLKLDCSIMFNKLGCPDERMDLSCTVCRKQWLIEKVEKKLKLERNN